MTNDLRSQLRTDGPTGQAIVVLAVPKGVAIREVHDKDKVRDATKLRGRPVPVAVVGTASGVDGGLLVRVNEFSFAKPSTLPSTGGLLLWYLPSKRKDTAAIRAELALQAEP